MMKNVLKCALSVAVFLCFAAGGASALPINERNSKIVPGPSGGEPSLQEILDKTFSYKGGRAIDVIEDQRNVAIFEQADLTVSKTWTVDIVNTGGTFGIYSYKDPSKKYDFFSVAADDDYPTATFEIEGSVGTGFSLAINSKVVDYDFGSAFGFFWKSGPETIYTEDTLNGGHSEVLVYNLKDGTEATLKTNFNGKTLERTYPLDGGNEWLFAFDRARGGNSDYQDGIFLVKDISAVPEPTTMLLVGFGLIGLAGMGRKKIK